MNSISQQQYFNYLKAIEDFEMVAKCGIRNVEIDDTIPTAPKFTSMPKGFFSYLSEFVRSFFDKNIKENNLKETNLKINLLRSNLNVINTMHRNLKDINFKLLTTDIENPGVLEKHIQNGSYYILRTADLHNQFIPLMQEWNDSLIAKGCKKSLDVRLGYNLDPALKVEDIGGRTETLNVVEMQPLSEKRVEDFTSRLKKMRTDRWTWSIQPKLAELKVFGGIYKKDKHTQSDITRDLLIMEAFVNHSPEGDKLSKLAEERIANPPDVFALEECLELITHISYEYKPTYNDIFILLDQIQRKYQSFDITLNFAKAIKHHMIANNIIYSSFTFHRCFFSAIANTLKTKEEISKDQLITLMNQIDDSNILDNNDYTSMLLELKDIHIKVKDGDFKQILRDWSFPKMIVAIIKQNKEKDLQSDLIDIRRNALDKINKIL